MRERKTSPQGPPPDEADGFARTIGLDTAPALGDGSVGGPGNQAELASRPAAGGPTPSSSAADIGGSGSEARAERPDELSVEEGDPPCWGEDAFPLLPPEWRPFLPTKQLVVKVVKTKQDGGRPWAGSLRELTRPRHWSAFDWWGPPACVASDAADSLVPHLDRVGILDAPLLEGPLRESGEASLLPLLTTTWNSLCDLAGGPEAAGDTLENCTGRQLHEATGSLRSTLDVLLTTSIWLEPDANGDLVARRPTGVTTIAEALQSCGLRYLRAAGIGADRLDPDSDRTYALLGRAGYHPSGRMTLEEAGTLIGVTRERIRQIQKGRNLSHDLVRRWPMPPCLKGLHDLMTNAEGRLAADVGQDIAGLTSWPRDTAVEVALRLLEAHGASLELVDSPGGRLARVDPYVATLRISASDVRRLAWDLSGNVGYLLRSELVRALDARFVSEGRDVPRETVDRLIDESLDMPHLPLGYAFTSTLASPAIVSTVLRLLAWSPGSLSIEEVHDALARMQSFRRKPPPPPLAVLAELLDRRHEFSVAEGIVWANEPIERDRGTLRSWLASLILESSLQVMHQNAIADAARRAGHNVVSVGVYLKTNELFVPQGRGCYSVVGHQADPVLVDMAWEEGRVLVVPSSVHAVVSHDEIVIDAIVGTSSFTSGHITLEGRVTRLLGSDRYEAYVNGKRCGDLWLSQSQQLYGFQPAWAALDIQPGDAMHVTINLSNCRAELSRAEDHAAETESFAI